jgi:hypothetical protein
VQTVQLAPSAALLRGIRAGSAPGAPGRSSHNPPVVGSSPTRPTRPTHRPAGRPQSAHPDRLGRPPGRRRPPVCCQVAIETGELAPDLAQLQGLKTGTIRHMFNALAESGFVRIRHGRTTTVAGDPEGDTRASGRLRLTRPQYGQDCKLSECKRHVCTPMAKSTIRIILSGRCNTRPAASFGDLGARHEPSPHRGSRRTAGRSPHLTRTGLLSSRPITRTISRARAMMSAVKDLFTLASQPAIRRPPEGSVIPSAG